MTVFKGYLKIAWKNRFLIFLYLGIFFGIVLMMQKSAKDSGGELYQTEGLNLAVVDEDHGAYAKSLIHYLEQRHQVQEMAPDKEKLQENLFYENVDYSYIEITKTLYELQIEKDVIKNNVLIKKLIGEYLHIRDFENAFFYMNKIKKILTI